jgi:hypothetical protein
MALGVEQEPVAETLSGLVQNTEYTVCLRAENTTTHQFAVSLPVTFTTALPPETPEGLSASPVAATTATLSGVLNPKAKGDAGSYEFLYEQGKAGCEGESKAPEPAGAATGDQHEEVSVVLSGLVPNTEYATCLLARNEAGETIVGPAVPFTTPPLAPVVESESVYRVGSAEATFEARINPGNSRTSYHFEYGPASGSYDVSVPIPDGEIDASLTGVNVDVIATGLTPGTAYRYRVVAANALPGVVDGSGMTFTTFASVGSGSSSNCSNEQARSEQSYGLELPDCRAYEMVSPLEKNDSDATRPSEDATRASLSGEAVTYESNGVFGGAEGNGSEEVNQYVARRGPDGWSTQAITPPYVGYTIEQIGAYRAMAFTPELTEGIAIGDTRLESEALAGYHNLFVDDFSSNPVSYRVVTTKPKDTVGKEGASPEIDGVSSDLSHVVYTEGELGNEETYEWADGETSGLIVGSGIGGGAEPGEDNGGILSNDSWRSVSADGSRVFYTSPEGYLIPDRQVWVRENPMSSVEDCSVPGDACTVEVSASQRKVLDPLGPGSARFRGASVNGVHVFFTDCSKLTEDATAVADGTSTRCIPGDEVGNDLYEYDLETGVLSDLTVDDLPADPLGAQVIGVADISEDGSYVYFVTRGTLAGENAEGKQPVSGEPNLYVAHYEGGSWRTRFIVTLAAPTNNAEKESTNAEELNGRSEIAMGGDSADWSQSPPLDTVRDTPDGTHLAFLSMKALTGYDNEQAEPGECETHRTESVYLGPEGGECREVFSYDAVSQKLVCASCNPSGARPTGPSSFGEIQTYAEIELKHYTPRNFSENGERLFFDSNDALVAHDSNGRRDVYEWEQDGEGSCGQSEGCVYPISDVAGDYESFFLDADPAGQNVFFGTEDQLVPSDTDFHIDVYDARVGGGYPVSVSPPVCDNGDSCKGPEVPQPSVFGAPASSTFTGAGNVAANPTTTVKTKPKTKSVKCKKSFVKKHDKCIKKKSKKSKKSVKSARKGRK